MRFKAAIKLDLPSEQTLDKPGTFARLLGARPTATGAERVLGSTLAVIDRFVHAFHSMGINNIVALRVDQRPIYLDSAMTPDDLQHVAASIRAQPGVLEQAFEMIHLVLELPAAGLHYVIDTKIRGQVPSGHEEVYVVIAGKVDALNPGGRETARTYRGRVLQLLAMPGFLDGIKGQFQSKVDDILEQLRFYTGALDGNVEFLEAGVVRPSRRSVQDLMRRPFAQLGMSFRSQLVGADSPAYFHDPYSFYYHNPFDTLVNLLIIGALLDGTATAMPIDTVIYNHDGHVFGIASHISSFHQAVSDVPPLASDRAAAALDTGTLHADPQLAASVAAYGRAVGDTTA